MIDRAWLGRDLPPSEMLVDRARLQFFARTIGETDPVYLDVSAARDAGYRDLPAPPTFLFSVELDSGTTDWMLREMEIPLAKLLHGEQSFRYHRPVCAGDRITVQSTISEIYDKKGGALEFVTRSSRVTNQNNELVAELRSVLVVRH
ncbi:MaoC family dehydratase N-terminal domain-containing protein [Pseudoduganella sp. UC29_106]|uniref:MaoC family dehydratase N-terminal domain-containing protein n=1 Tax=Pseudoduganella sp. UC29_106 TaxID=3374553 RepID=UPI003756E594